MHNRSESVSIIKSLNRAFDIMEVLRERKDGMTLSQLKNRLGLSAATAYRMLNTMVQRGYIVPDAEKKYRLGTKFIEMSGMSTKTGDLIPKVIPYMDRLLAEINETIHLSVLDRGEAVDIYNLESSNHVRVCTGIGLRLPLHASSVGKVLLAYLPEDRMESIIGLKGLQHFTENTISTLSDLRQELANVRQQGFAIDDREFDMNARCVAAPIRDHANRVIAALGISGLADRCSPEDIEAITPMLKETCDRISRDLGSTESSTSV